MTMTLQNAMRQQQQHQQQHHQLGLTMFVRDAVKLDPGTEHFAQALLTPLSESMFTSVMDACGELLLTPTRGPTLLFHSSD
jgi:hypothetical protein